MLSLISIYHPSSKLGTNLKCCSFCMVDMHMILELAAQRRDERFHKSVYFVNLLFAYRHNIDVFFCSETGDILHAVSDLQSELLR